MDSAKLGQEPKPQVMTVPELAKYLRLSQAKVYRMAKEGSIPAFQIGRSWRFKKELIDAWIELGSRLSPEVPAAPP
jgi:excisionase family DNA binding protein